MKPLTVIVPTWNMGKFLPALVDSIAKSEFADAVEEILFVCEKSTDGSEQVIARLAEQVTTPQIRMLQPEQRRGLFVARYLGAKSARTEKIMFIDSRITLPPATTRALPGLLRRYPAMSSVVDIDIHKNIFCLYWQRSHERMFRKTYVANAQGATTVDSQNFASHRIGGTCFYCSREPFVKMSEKYLGQPLFSDDTYLMQDLVAVEPFTVHPDFRIQWEPRDTWSSFLRHLYLRGPGFAEYHLFHRRGLLFVLVLTGAIAAMVTLGLLLVEPMWGLSILGATLGLLALSTVLMSRSITEFVRLVPLHMGVVIYYGVGALRGAWIVWRKRRRGRARTQQPISPQR